MATIYTSILGWEINAGSSGDVFPEPYSIKATNDRWKYLVWVFNNGASPAELFGGFRVPNDYVGSASIVALYTSTATTGSIVLAFNYRTVASGVSGQSFDQTTQTESTSAAFSAPSAANLRRDAVIPLTSSSLTNGQKVQFEILRDPTSASDDLAAAITLHGLYLGYSTT